MKPPILLTVDVFKALLCHALRPSSVAKNFWEFLEPHFNDALKEHGDPTDSQSLILIPHNGEWTTVENKLLEFRELNLDALTKEMNSHACAWITGLLLPIRSWGKTPVSLKSGIPLHNRVARFRRQILKREEYICPVTLLKDWAGPGAVNEESAPRVMLDAAHILPFSIRDSHSLVWKYIQMFTGDTKIKNIVCDINVVENGILLEKNVHATFGNLEWGMETKTEGVGTGTELLFFNETGLNPPNLDLCALHLAVCAVASACGATDVFNNLFEDDPDIIGPESGEYTLPTDPTLDDFLIPYFERRLYEEESTHVLTLHNFGIT